MPNRLARETSPYLRQHADNPVDWYPWGEEALAEAKRTGKPLLLSVGYSACHWCHVMAHESFEDAETARVMNELFVNVKVDREERPDIDQIYQSAQAMLTRRNGGWPLTMFLTPQQVPFFGGTYFPNTARYGMPAFGDLLRRVREYYDQNPDEIREQGQALAAALERMQPAGGGALSTAPLEAAQEELAQSFDPEHGGFGAAPKFPHVEMIELLLRRWHSTRDTPAGEQALAMALTTLRSMARGGIYDQLGGGFARYSVDAEWAIPHFEKMLYDNALLLRAYADAWAITREPLFARVCEETAAWTMREMQSPAGGYWSSLDADSEGEEGRYYVWSVDEVRSLLDPAEFAVASTVYGLDKPPNFEGHAWNLVVARTVEEVARSLGIDAKVAHERIARARAKLLAARAQRVRPGLDDKVLASWNALMIAGMAHAGRVLGRPEWIASAERALAQVRRVLWKDGRLLATAHGDHAHLDAYLDDHAYLLAALLEMLSARWDTADLEWARKLASILLERFQDPGEGGFFFTASDHEALIHRPKPGPDNATPSGNAVAAWALNRLSFLTGEARYAEAARATVELFQPALERMPSAFGTMLAALAEQLTPPRTIILRGPASALAPWSERLASAFLPDAVVLSIPDGTDGLPEPLAKPERGGAAAWVCEGATCLAPIDSLAELVRALALAEADPTLHSAN